MADNFAHPYYRRQIVTINDLADDVLLEIFDFYVVRYQDLQFTKIVSGTQDTIRKIRSWQSLVHVCRRWRYIVFTSPRRLNLQLYCTTGTPARGTLDVWPALPLLIQGDVSETSVDNVIAELEHSNSNRICQISLSFHTTSQIEKLWTTMQVPFPELTGLFLSFRTWSYGRVYGPALPDSFLGGSAPRLRYFHSDSIPFPGLPKLLPSTTHLVSLWLINTPHSGYFSPEVAATCLSMLTSLEFLQLEFESPQSCPDQETRRSPPPTRYVLPALTAFSFKGVNEYSEELVAQIDAPRLLQLHTTFFNDINFDTPELIRLVSHSSTLKAPNEAHVVFGSQTASVKLQSHASDTGYFEVAFSCRESDWQLSSVAQICTTSLPLLSTTGNLFIYEQVDSQLNWKVGIENIEWLELLLPFTAVKNLYLSKQFAPRIAPALQDMARGGTTEVLSTLQNLYLEGFRPSIIPLPNGQLPPGFVPMSVSSPQQSPPPEVMPTFSYSTPSAPTSVAVASPRMSPRTDTRALYGVPLPDASSSSESVHEDIESVHDDIERFISARQLTDHPVAISVWNRSIWDDSKGTEPRALYGLPLPDASSPSERLSSSEFVHEDIESVDDSEEIDDRLLASLAIIS